MFCSFTDCLKTARDGLKRSETLSDWDSGREGNVETSSRGRHIKRIVFDEGRDLDYVAPVLSHKGQKSITHPPCVSFKGKIDHACLSMKF